MSKELVEICKDCKYEPDFDYSGYGECKNKDYERTLPSPILITALNIKREGSYPDFRFYVWAREGKIPIICCPGFKKQGGE